MEHALRPPVRAPRRQAARCHLRPTRGAAGHAVRRPGDLKRQLSARAEKEHRVGQRPALPAQSLVGRSGVGQVPMLAGSSDPDEGALGQGDGVDAGLDAGPGLHGVSSIWGCRLVDAVCLMRPCVASAMPTSLRDEGHVLFVGCVIGASALECPHADRARPDRAGSAGRTCDARVSRCVVERSARHVLAHPARRPGRPSGSVRGWSSRSPLGSMVVIGGGLGAVWRY